MKKECYDYTIELPFENMNIVAPEMYDEVLRAEYGDYMVPVKGQLIMIIHFMDICNQS